MTDKAFCPHCYEDVSFSTVEETETIELDGTCYSFQVKKAICAICGTTAVYDPYREEAGMVFNDVVRESNGIVSLAIVRDLPKKYNIGKRPLSQLLGWGEITYSRFVEGAVPNKEYSDRIRELYEHPESFRVLLQQNGNRLKPVAKKKALDAVNSILKNQYPDAVRIYEVAERIIDLAGGDITRKALQKIVYYTQAFSAVLCDRPLFSQAPRAWVAGPVYGQLWYEYKDGIFETDGDNAEDSPFTEEENELIEEVYRAFGKYSGPELSKFTHSEPPWLEARARAGVKEGERCEEKISLDCIRTYFQSVVDEYEIKSLSDIGRYAQALATTDF